MGRYFTKTHKSHLTFKYNGMPNGTTFAVSTKYRSAVNIYYPVTTNEFTIDRVTYRVIAVDPMFIHVEPK